MEHLRRRGLHLNHKGNGQLTKNIISKVKSFLNRSIVLHLEEPLRRTTSSSIHNLLNRYILNKNDIKQVDFDGISTRTNIVQNNISNSELNSKNDDSFNHGKLKSLRLA